MQATNQQGQSSKPIVKSVDLFCGAGGLTRGLEKAGINVSLGVDLDPECKFPYEKNNKARFLLKSVSDVSQKELADAFDIGAVAARTGLGAAGRLWRSDAIFDEFRAAFF